MAKTKKHNFDYDLIVIGTGAGGSAAATLAARNGKKVAVIEAETFGGESPNYGDVPIKSLLHAAQLYDEARAGARFGIRSQSLGYNYPSFLAWKDLAVKRTGAGGNRRYYEKEGISTFNSSAHFLSPHEISVNRRHLSAANFLIATGSYWEIPKIPGIDSIKYLTPKSLLDLTRPPKSLMILGSGSVAVETAQLMATFGTRVYLVEAANRILPHEDSEVGELLERLLREGKGVTSLTSTKPLSVQKEALGVRVTLSRGGHERSIKVDELMIAGSRLPKVDLGLENASVSYTQKGIEVNDYLQTSARHIFATGDVLGRSTTTHSALLESRVAAHNIYAKNKITPDYTAEPRITFTWPSVASVGLSENDCIKRDLDVKKSLAPLNLITRSNTSDFRDGFVKLISDKRGVLLGATIVAPAAPEMIHELSLAIKYGLLASDVAETPHAFLSWSEAIRAAAAKLSQ